MRLSRAIVRNLVRFGLPNQLTFAGSFIVTFGDRFFLQAHRSVSEVGLYALAYQFGFLLNQVAADPFLKAWDPQMYQLARLPAAERDPRLNRGLFFFSLFLVTGGVGLALGTPVLLRVMTTPAFRSAADVVPVILLAYALQGWMFLLKFGTDYAEQPGRFTIATWVSVVVTVVAYALLIPRWGGFGAAWATVIGFAVRLGVSYYWSQRLWPIAYHWGRVVALTACAVVVVIAHRFVPAVALPQAIAGTVAGFGVYVLLVWFIVLHADERKTLSTMIQSPRRSFATMMGSVVR
jgi:O-antigen/teichoic acid export membrane protein